MKNTIAFLAALLCLTTVSAQDNCFFPARKGAELTYKYLDRRGKALKDQWKQERWMKFTVEEVWPQEDGVIINVGIANETIERLAKSKSTEQVAENLSYGDVKIMDDSVVLDNMQWVAEVTPDFFVYISRLGDDGPKYRVELMALTSFPRKMSVGDTLPDENILDAKYMVVLTEEEKAEMEKQRKEFEMEIMAMTGARASIFNSSSSFDVRAQTRNRKVEAFEKIETPAGTFDCYKITYELLVPNRLGSAFFASLAYSNQSDGEAMKQAQQVEGVKYADWISPEVGLVKREKYNNKGKVQEVMRLESVK